MNTCCTAFTCAFNACYRCFHAVECMCKMTCLILLCVGAYTLYTGYLLAFSKEYIVKTIAEETSVTFHLGLNP